MARERTRLHVRFTSMNRVARRGVLTAPRGEREFEGPHDVRGGLWTARPALKRFVAIQQFHAQITASAVLTSATSGGRFHRTTKLFFDAGACLVHGGEAQSCRSNDARLRIKAGAGERVHRQMFNEP